MVRGKRLNLYIVASPLQLLNALEARARFPADEHWLFLRFASQFERNAHQIDYLLRLFPWKKVIDVRFNSRLLGRHPYEIDFFWLLRLLPYRFGHIFIGDPRPFPFRLLGLNLRTTGELVLLDDGAATITFQRDPSLLIAPRKPARDRKRKLIRRAREALGLRFEYGRTPDLFTCFDLEAQPGQRVWLNDYPWLRRQMSHAGLQTDNKVWFLGSALSEKGLVSSERLFFDIMRRVREHFADMPFVYIAHRHEQPTKLARMERELNMEIVEFDLPVELAFWERKVIPGHVASFFSTALFTLGKIYPSTPRTALDIPERLLVDKHREAAAGIMAQLKRDGVDVHPLPGPVPSP